MGFKKISLGTFSKFLYTLLDNMNYWSYKET